MPAEDRRVAEWVLFEGGRVGLAGRADFVGDVADLPRADFSIETLDLTGTLIEPPALERIGGLRSLKNLYLAGPMWNRNADDGRDHSGDLRAVSGISSLEKLTFSYHFLDRTRFRDPGLSAIDKLTNLRELSVRQSGIKGHTLSPFRKLEALDVTLTPFDDDGLKNLSGSAGMRRLWAGDTLITNAGLSSIAALSKLEDLDLHGTQVSDAGLIQLARLKGLRKLNLMGTGITDDGLEILRSFTGLEYLNLYRTRITNAGLDRLRPLTELREMDLRYTRVSRAGISGLKTSLAKTSFIFIDASPVSSAKPTPRLTGKGDAAITP